MSRAGLFLGVCSLGLVAVSGVLDPDAAFASENFLANGGFEDSEGATPSGWLKRPSTLLVVATDSAGMVYSGQRAVLLSSATSSVKYVFQTVRAESGKKYRLSGFVRVKQGKVTPYLRLAWYASGDGSGSELGFADSDRVQRTEGDWTRLEVSQVLPSGVGSLQVRASIYPADSAAVSVLYDELGLSTESWEVPTGSNPAGLEVEYDSPSEVTEGESFGVAVRIGRAVRGEKYLVKAMGGKSSSASGMKSLVTLGSNGEWLAWNGSWVGMPGVMVDGGGKGEVTVKSKFDLGVAGRNYFLVRVRKDGSQDNFDGPTKTIVVKEKQAVVRSDEPGSKTLVEKVEKSVSSTSGSPEIFGEVESGEMTGTGSGDRLISVLGTRSANSVTASGAVRVQPTRPVARAGRGTVAEWVFGGGSVLTFGAIGWFLYNRKRKELL